MKKLRGILAALSTPMTEKAHSIDVGRFRAHIDDMIQAGIHGVVPASGTGEYAYLNDDERYKLIEAGVKHVNGRVPVVAQTTAMSTQDVIERCKHAQGLGVDALMILPPYLEIPDERAIIRHYEFIARAVSTPIILYNVPSHAAEVTDDMFRELRAIENLDYIKDSSGDFSGLQKLIAVGGDVLTGIDSFAPYALLAGCKGMIWGAANFMPHECARLYDLIEADKIAEAFALWDSMKGIAMWLEGNRHDVRYLAGIKAAARLTGRDLGPARRPLPPVPGPARHDIRLALSTLPVNRSKEDHLVWRNWQEERDWLIQDHLGKSNNTAASQSGQEK